MTYYKMILDDNIVGVACTDNFITFSPVVESFLRSDEKRGEFICWHGNIYRDTWMQPIQFAVDYISVQVREITEEEYNIFSEAFKINDVIKYEREQEEEVIEQPIRIDPVLVSQVEFIRSSKLNEMSHTCRQTIEAGFDLELRGETHHFSLDTQDQLNLISLSAMAQTQTLIPYHADGEECIFYTAEEINAIVAKATEFKIYHTTYYNALKTYINALDTIEDIAAIQYGTPIPEEYQSDVLKAIQA